MDFRLFTISKKGFLKKTYEIYEGEKLIYTAESKMWLRGFKVFAILGNQIMDIKKPFSLFKTIIKVYAGEREMATVTRKIAFLKSKIDIETPEGLMYIEGNVWATDFTIFKDDEEVAKISRKTFRSKDKYGIACRSDIDERLIIGITLAIEFIIQIKQARSSG